MLILKDWQNETRGQGADAEPSEAGPLFLAGRPSCSEQDVVHLSPKTDKDLGKVTILFMISANIPKSDVPELPFLRPAHTLIPTVIDMQDVQRQIAALLDTCEHSAPPGFEQLPRQQRRPCLGWIGPKDDDDFVLLEPMQVEGEEERRRARGKLKSRWDEKPDDVVQNVATRPLSNNNAERVAAQSTKAPDVSYYLCIGLNQGEPHVVNLVYDKLFSF
ncbi:hypothetical protein Cgig2_017093 [Carnegiea gigantea]|uniref:Uncharacterized protein n=1 Tax=Carnegiea gigantea TaxID=171969 RepID=A0A9Q1QCU9_9CARY|nr:hypothetical protein Cgig2_017093 [Carnegiea gigantea]